MSCPVMITTIDNGMFGDDIHRHLCRIIKKNKGIFTYSSSSVSHNKKTMGCLDKAKGRDKDNFYILIVICMSHNIKTMGCLDKAKGRDKENREKKGVSIGGDNTIDGEDKRSCPVMIETIDN